MRGSIAAGIIVAGALGLIGDMHATEPLRIIRIGGSITHGGRADRDEYTYRCPLFCPLKELK